MHKKEGRNRKRHPQAQLEEVKCVPSKKVKDSPHLQAKCFQVGLPYCIGQL